MPDKPENSAFKLLSSRKTLVMATADKNGTPNVSLSPAFAAPAAYGDLVATILAIFATFGLAAHASWAIGVVWLLNVWGMRCRKNQFLFCLKPSPATSNTHTWDPHWPGLRS